MPFPCSNNITQLLVSDNGCRPLRFSPSPLHPHGCPAPDRSVKVTDTEFCSQLSICCKEGTVFRTLLWHPPCSPFSGEMTRPREGQTSGPVLTPLCVDISLRPGYAASQVLREPWLETQLSQRRARPVGSYIECGSPHPSQGGQAIKKACSAFAN